MTRNTFYNVKPAFVVDPASIVRNSGRQVDWNSVPESYRQGSTAVTGNATQGAAYEATAVPITALGVTLPAGQALNFGTWAAVTVQANGAVAIGATTMACTTLAGTVPLGTMLDFGAWSAVTVAVHAGDTGAATLAVEALPGPLPAGAIVLLDDDMLVRVSAAAASGATGVSVSPLAATAVTGAEGVWPGGDKLVELAAEAASGVTGFQINPPAMALATGDEAVFAGGARAAVLSTNANAATTSLPVHPLALPIPVAQVAYINGTGAKTLPAGKVMVELTGGLIMPRADATGGELAIGFLETNAIEGSESDSKSGYGVITGGALYENLLPDVTSGTTGTLNATWKAEMAATTNYGVGRFIYEQYADNRS